MFEPLTGLLPLRALVITLEFTGKARFSFFHQPAVHAFVRGLLGSPPNFASLFTIDAPETGRIDYASGDLYRFAVYALPGGEGLLVELINRLRKLPEGAPMREPAVPLRDNLRLSDLHDLFTGQPVQGIGDLTLYDGDRLEAETQIWSAAPRALLRWLSPTRLLRDKKERIEDRGERRYCREADDLHDGLFLKRLYDSFAGLQRERGRPTLPRGEPPPHADFLATLFWLDSEYRDDQGNANPIGGMSGEIVLGAGSRLPPEWWRMLVLGQYLGIGQRRAFGLGRYRLEATDGSATASCAEPATSLMRRAADQENLYDAYRAMRDNLEQKRRKLHREAQQDAEEEWWQARYPDPPDPEDEERLADRLERVAGRLGKGEHEAQPLQGVVISEPDGDLRALAIPPFWDRVVQRAVNQQIAPALEQLMYQRSYGYRRGRSRQGASLDIQQAWRQGYRWVYEADVDDFFDNVDWNSLVLRLKALYRDDPIVDLLLAWVGAPVDYQGMRIERHRGLPQGAPVSPVLANLMLDDFDSDLESAGFRLVRFADDFVVLCKDKAQAESAGEAVRRSLRELGLTLNEEKSRAVSFEQGFRYLGYLFLNDMVLDSAGNKGETDAKAPSPPPPNSWLAKVGRHRVTELASLANKKPEPTPVAKSGRLALGERKEQGTQLILTGNSALLTTREGRLIVTRDSKIVSETPWRGLSAVVLFGNHHVSTPAVRVALANSVPIHLATGGGRYQGAIWNGTPGSEGSALWLRQLELAQDPEASTHVARQLVLARLRHMREVLRQRDPIAFPNERLRINEALKQVGKAQDLETLNGIEGNATRLYFQGLAALVPDEYEFSGRNRRPPRDPFNSLLSLGYTLLYCHVETLLRADGLFPWRGFYHQSHGRHAALASDLMEPFRHLVERTALTAVTRHRIKPGEFRDDPKSGCRLSTPAMKIYLAMLWERFDKPIQAVGEVEPHSALYHIHHQNRRLVEWLRGEAEFNAWVSR